MAKPKADRKAKGEKPKTKPKAKAEAEAQGLTVRQAKFVQEYLIDLNGTQAALRAGYAVSGAKVEAARQLTNANVARAIDEAMSKNPGVTRARIVDELAKIAFANAKTYFQWGPDGVTVRDSDELDDDAAVVVSEVSHTSTPTGGTIRVKLSDKQGALDKLTRILGGYRDKLALTDPDGGKLFVEFST